MPSTPSSAPPDGPPLDGARTTRSRLLLVAIALLVIVAIATVTWLSVRDDGTSDDTARRSTPTATGPNSLDAVVVDGLAEVGTTAPDFELETLDGGTQRLSDLRGTPVVLNFWASWCTPCRREFPVLRAADRAADGKYAVIGVNTGDIRADAKTFAKDERAKWPNGFDTDGSVAKLYGVRPLPQTIFIDADGKIVARIALELGDEQLDRGIAKAQRTAS